MTDLLMLQGLRLAGVASADRLESRALLPAEVIERELERQAASGYIERLSLGDFGGWVLTSRGAAYLADLLEHDLREAGSRTVLEATVEEFDDLNARFVDVVSEWQLRSSDDGTDPSVGDEAESLLRVLSSMSAELRELLAPLIRALPRFGRYPAQFGLALEKARGGDMAWVAGVGILSCHVVWAELHQDLLSSLGRERNPERGPQGSM